MVEVIIAALVIGGLGAIFGIGLSYASKVFSVKIDERVLKIREILPGANCGACGFAGCDAFAYVVADGKAAVTDCPVGGEAVAQKLANIMGVKVVEVEKSVARVMCNGRCSVSKEKYSYRGIDDCFAAVQLFVGHKACSYGCLGHGNCAKVCPFNAIDMIGGIARVIEDRCKACGKCIEACPKNLIKMVPKDKKYSVICCSKNNGAVTKKNCEVGCIGCAQCVKVCRYGAVSVEGHLAMIDYNKCTNCGECAVVCPTMAIRKMDFDD